MLVEIWKVLNVVLILLTKGKKNGCREKDVDELY